GSWQNASPKPVVMIWRCGTSWMNKQDMPPTRPSDAAKLRGCSLIRWSLSESSRRDDADQEDSGAFALRPQSALQDGIVVSAARAGTGAAASGRPAATRWARRIG